MNRAMKMLEVLRDGKPHARREIFERAGFMLTNNAASELREQGYDVRQSRERVDGVNVYFYTLHGSLDEGEPQTGDALSPSDGSRLDADSLTAPSPSSSEYEQLRIEAA